jgi:hypothetical protein
MSCFDAVSFPFPFVKGADGHPAGSWENTFQQFAREGDTWHVISCHWWDAWCEKSGFVDPFANNDDSDPQDSVGNDEHIESSNDDVDAAGETGQSLVPASNLKPDQYHTAKNRPLTRLRKIDNSDLVVHSSKQQVESCHFL